MAYNQIVCKNDSHFIGCFLKVKVNLAIDPMIGLLMFVWPTELIFSNMASMWLHSENIAVKSLNTVKVYSTRFVYHILQVLHNISDILRLK